MRAFTRDPLAAYNERMKLLAAFLNALSIGLIGFAILRPLTDIPSTITWLSAPWGIGGLVLHGLAHYILGYIRKGGQE